MWTIIPLFWPFWRKDEVFFNSQNVVTILGSMRYFAELRNFAKKGRYLNFEIIITKWSTTFYYAMMQPHHIAKKMKFHVKVSCSLHKQNFLSVIFSWKMLSQQITHVLKRDGRGEKFFQFTRNLLNLTLLYLLHTPVSNLNIFMVLFFFINVHIKATNTVTIMLMYSWMINNHLFESVIELNSKTSGCNHWLSV